MLAAWPLHGTPMASAASTSRALRTTHDPRNVRAEIECAMTAPDRDRTILPARRLAADVHDQEEYVTGPTNLSGGTVQICAGFLNRRATHCGGAALTSGALSEFGYAPCGIAIRRARASARNRVGGTPKCCLNTRVNAQRLSKPSVR